MNPLLSAFIDLLSAAAAERLALADLHRRSDGKGQVINVAAGAALAAKADGPLITCIHRETEAFMMEPRRLPEAIPCKFHNVKAGETCPDEGFTEAPEDMSALGMVQLDELDAVKADLDAVLREPVEAPVVADKGGITFYEGKSDAPPAIPDLQHTASP